MASSYIFKHGKENLWYDPIKVVVFEMRTSSGINLGTLDMANMGWKLQTYVHPKTNWVYVYSEYLDYMAFLIDIWFLLLLLKLES